jgi:hypothetical protein
MYVTGLSDRDNIVNCALSLAGELGEYTVADGFDSIILEAGDCLFYAVLLVEFLNLDFASIVVDANNTLDEYNFPDAIAKLGDITKKAFFWGSNCKSFEVYSEQYYNVLVLIIWEISGDVPFYDLDILMKCNMDKLSNRKPVG